MHYSFFFFELNLFFFFGRGKYPPPPQSCRNLFYIFACTKWTSLLAVLPSRHPYYWLLLKIRYKRSFPLLEQVLKFTKPIYCDGGGPVFEHLTDMGQMSVNKTMTVEFISVGGQAFREYAKSAEFGKGEILWYPESWNCLRLKTNFVHRLKLSIQRTENTQKIKFA